MNCPVLCELTFNVTQQVELYYMQIGGLSSQFVQNTHIVTQDTIKLENSVIITHTKGDCCCQHEVYVSPVILGKVLSVWTLFLACLSFILTFKYK